MAKAHKDIKVALLQARTSKSILAQEQDCFIERCEIQPEQLLSLNLPDQPVPADLLSHCDVVMIGGAGEFSATETYFWTPGILDLIVAAAEKGFPLFGSCWGHQMIARALGGNVIYDRERTEMGCHWVELNKPGQQDVLFRRFPTRFKANMGHHDRVATLPAGATELAFNASQPNQAFRLNGHPIYGTQFHSELDAQREKERLYAYRNHYTEVETEEDFQEIVQGLAETTEVDGLLLHFLRTFVTGSP